MVKNNSKRVVKKNMISTRKSKRISMPKMSYIKMIIKELHNQQQENPLNFTSERKLLNLIGANYRVSKHLKQRKKFLQISLDVLENEKKFIHRKKNSIRLRKKFFKNFKITSNNSKKISKTNKNTQQKNKTSKTNKNSNCSTLKYNPQIKTNFFSSPLNLAVLLPPMTVKAEKQYKKRWPAVWQYYDDKNFNARVKRADGWYDYDPEASDIVEDEWQRYIVNRGMNDVRAVKSGEWQYMVDFVNWKQTNIIHQNHKQRSIRRLDESGKVSHNPYQC
jgi:hypothetical protein